MRKQAGRQAGTACHSKRSVTRLPAFLRASFLALMHHRCGWASKPNQETVLAITLKRPFFERMLAASLSTSAGTTAKGPCIGADVVLQARLAATLHHATHPWRLHLAPAAAWTGRAGNPGPCCITAKLLCLSSAAVGP